MQNISFKYGMIMQEQVVYLTQNTSICDNNERAEFIFMNHHKAAKIFHFICEYFYLCQF